MTPLHIHIMLHYYARTTPYAEHEPSHRFSAATIQYKNELLKKEMLTPSISEDVFVVTEKGRAYVEALKAVKEPIAKTVWEQP